MVNELSEFLSLKDEVEALRKERQLLIARVSKWKRKYEAVAPRKPVRETRTKRAREMVIAWHNGDKSKTFSQIASECFLSRETIKNISYKYKHKECNNETQQARTAN